MITNFEEYTQDLNSDEHKLVPILVSAFKQRTINNPIKAPEIIQRVNQYLNEKSMGFKLTEPRLRKIVNHIRTNSLLPLIATSKGYYYSTERKDIIDQIESLEQRANSIARCALGLKKFLT